MSERVTCPRCGDYVDGGGVCPECLERARATRRENLQGELALRRLSGHFYLLGMLGAFASVFGGLAVSATRTGYVALGVGVAVCVAVFALGHGVARLRPWSVVGARVIGVLLLFAFPLGTLLGLEALYVTVRYRELSRAEYREIVALTPELDEPPIPVWQWVVIALLVAAIPAWFLLRAG